MFSRYSADLRESVDTEYFIYWFYLELYGILYIIIEEGGEIMNPEQLKDVIVALINNEYFPKYTENEAEKLAKDIAKFQKIYYKEMK
ncbi:hypothetical protein [Clostridium butyricum]|uniref:Uncharacterized protein n=1 Tax=Clostridium butyricum TaxID=1492 RepID=A0A6N3CVF2_CLOBU|nr:hypothetical protein [Clostridium butyricum]MDU1340223.1 hypothetical protein [Clostridium butyricum]